MDNNNIIKVNDKVLYSGETCVVVCTRSDGRLLDLRGLTTGRIFTLVRPSEVEKVN